jgi:hypothetical protein
LFLSSGLRRRDRTLEPVRPFVKDGCSPGRLDMGTKQAAVLVLGSLLVGVAIARLGIHSSGAVAEKTAESAAAENKLLKEQLAQLEGERVSFLESELAKSRAVTPVPAPAAPAGESAREPAPAVPKIDPRNLMNGSEAARLLGLEGGRRKQFEESYDLVLSKVRDAEKQHATVLRQGDEVEVHIPPFPQEAALLKREWSDLLLTSLMPQELLRYQDLQLDQILFPREMGVWDRTMVFQPQDTVWPRVENGNRYWPTFYERWTKPGDVQVDPSTRWPWGGPAAYQCYRHLLDPSDCRVRED